jgi:hypothetical protein
MRGMINNCDELLFADEEFILTEREISSREVFKKLVHPFESFDEDGWHFFEILEILSKGPTSTKNA